MALLHITRITPHAQATHSWPPTDQTCLYLSTISLSGPSPLQARPKNYPTSQDSPQETPPSRCPCLLTTPPCTSPLALFVNLFHSISTPYTSLLSRSFQVFSGWLFCDGLLIIDSEPDLHFRLRPHLSRSAPCICGCGEYSSIYPFSISQGAYHSSHLVYDYLYTLHLPPDIDDSNDFLVGPSHPPLPPAPHSPLWQKRNRSLIDSLDFLPALLRKWCSTPCVLCGCGDNSVQHWLLFCPIPARAGSLLLRKVWKTQYWFFSASSSFSHRAIISGLWGATRQFVHERSGLPPPSLVLSYRPSASDHKGRLYPAQLGAAKLPKLLHTLLFGATHVEIDLVGSHYQLFQRFHRACSDTALPSVQQLRRLLYDDMSIRPCTLLDHRPKAPKDLPTHLLNSTLDQTLEYYRQFGYYPSLQVRQALQRINSAKSVVFAHLDSLFGPRTLDSLSSRNRAFHILEHPETLWLRHFIAFLAKHHPPTSII